MQDRQEDKGHRPPFMLPGEDPNAPRLNTLLNFVESEVEQALQGDRSEDKLFQMASKAEKLAEREIGKFQVAVGEAAWKQKASPIQCRAGCCHCCYRVPEASIPELLALWKHVQIQFTPEEKEALRLRVESYVQETQELRPADLDKARQPCPFLVDSMCSAYDARPISCRGLNSTDVSVCEAIRLGSAPAETRPIWADQERIASSIRSGLRLAAFYESLDPITVDIGHAFNLLLQKPEAGEEYVQGKNRFRSSRSYFECEGFDLASLCWRWGPAYRSPSEQSSPTGNLSQPETLAFKERNDLFLNDGRFRDALALFDRRNALDRMAHVRVPRIAMSESEIDETRADFLKAMDDFEQAQFDPSESFNALTIHQTMSLTYQGRDDLDILTRHGRFVEDISAAALPDLVRPIEGKRKPGKLRVGYLSGNLNGSNGGRWAADWLRHHGEDIETFSFLVGVNSDAVTERFREFSNHFYWLNRSVSENARFVRSLDLDVLIFTDIGLFPRNSQYASLRLARTQCTAWGHPDTSGFSTIDYYLSSELMEPEDGDRFYLEKLVRLPRAGLVFYPERPEQPPRDRVFFGLNEKGPIFFMAQSLMKLVPKFDHLYAEICERTGAEIVFLESNASGDSILLKRRLEQNGVRAKWLPYQSYGDFLALMSLADVSIDPPLWSGGNSTVHALMVGTPVVTLPGPFMRSRHSYAFLQMAGAAGLIAKDESDFVDLVCDLDRQKEAAKGMDTAPIFGDVGVVRALDEFLLNLK